MAKTLALEKTSDLVKHKAELDHIRKHVLGKRMVIIAVFAPWCGHCKDFKPAFEAAVKKLANKRPASAPAALGSGKRKKIGGDHNPLTVLRFSDETLAEIQAGGDLLSYVLKKQVGGYPTVIAVGPHSKPNTMSILHFNEERSVEGVQRFISNISNISKI